MPRRKPLGPYELLTLAVLTVLALGAFIAATYVAAYLLWGC